VRVSDEELIRRFVNRGDEGAFRALYARHSPAVYGLLRRLAGPAVSDADDALQDAWLRAATRLSSFRGESAFRTWLTGIALNCLRERWRRAQRIDERGDVSRLETHAPHNDHAVDVAEVLDTLSADHREVLVLHDVEGYTHEEIAGALGIETGTSKSRLSRARQLFRERWQQAPAAGAKS
jgi:RNA polymerase sigma-70 factor (ECF subfamily)